MQNQGTNPSTVIIVQKQKSVGTAFLLAFLFGPLGLLYASIAGGLIMFVVSLILFFLLPIVGAILCWIVCIIWAVVASQNANKNISSNITINH